MSKAKKVAARLLEALEASGLKQSDLASRLGLSRAIVSQWASGDKEIPQERYDQIAAALKVDRNFLTGAYVAPVVPSDDVRQVVWTFRPAPIDGGRDYGNSNIFGTPPDIKTLVRETGQNSKDQRLHDKVHIRYHFIELHKNSAPYLAFLQAIRFEELRQHIEAAGKTGQRRGNQLRAALQRLEESDHLYLLRIDDFGCTGLYGKERSEGTENPFAALIRNNLDSAKRSKTAGGSFGLGKATLWRCSELSTVLFSSELGVHAEPSNAGQLRFIAKSELTWHQHDSQDYAGPGWLGKNDSGSLWTSRDQLAPLFLDRTQPPAGVGPAASSGTSALIVGFQDPRAEETVDAEAIIKSIEIEAALNFWPAIVRDELAVTVAYQVDNDVRFERPVDPLLTEARPFVLALRAHQDGDIVDEPDAGETARCKVDFTIPATHLTARDVPADQPPTDAPATLLVRLAEDKELGSKLLNEVALVRGRGMVVEYWPRKNILVGAKAFHGVLLAGEASEVPSPSAEVFLRLSEPPAHDRWVFNEDLRDNYRRGAGANLNRFFESATGALKDIIRPETIGVDEQPEDLMRLLRIGGGTAPARPPAQLRSVTWEFQGGLWTVQGQIKILEKKKPMVASLSLGVQPESGRAVAVPWETIVIEKPRGGTPTVRADYAIDVPPNVSSFSFVARSRPSPHALRLEQCRAAVTFSAETQEVKAQEVSHA